MWIPWSSRIMIVLWLAVAFVVARIGLGFRRWDEDIKYLEGTLLYDDQSQPSTRTPTHSSATSGPAASSFTPHQHQHQQQAWEEIPPVVQRYLSRIFASADDMPLMQPSSSSIISPSSGAPSTADDAKESSSTSSFSSPHHHAQPDPAFTVRQLSLQQSGQFKMDGEWIDLTAKQIITPRGFVWEAALCLMGATKFPKRIMYFRNQLVLRAWWSWWQTALRSILTLWICDAFVFPESENDITTTTTGDDTEDTTSSSSAVVLPISRLQVSWMRGGVTLVQSDELPVNELWEGEITRWLAETPLIPTVLLPRYGFVKWSSPVPQQAIENVTSTVSNMVSKCVNSSSHSSPATNNTTCAFSDTLKDEERHLQQQQQQHQAILEFVNPMTPPIAHAPTGNTTQNQSKPIQLLVTFDHDHGWLTRIEGRRPMIQDKDIVKIGHWVGIYSSYRWIDNMWIPTYMESGWKMSSTTSDNNILVEQETATGDGNEEDNEQMVQKGDEGERKPSDSIDAASTAADGVDKNVAIDSAAADDTDDDDVTFFVRLQNVRLDYNIIQKNPPPIVAEEVEIEIEVL